MLTEAGHTLTYDGDNRLGNTCKPGESKNLIPMREAARLCRENALTVDLHLRNLRADDLVVLQHSFDIATKERWQRMAVSRQQGR